MNFRVIPWLCLLPVMPLGNAYAHGDVHDRISKITAEIQTSPAARLFFRRGCLHLENGQAMAALADFENADRLDPRAFETAPLRAESLMLLGKLPLALRTLDRCLEQNPAASRCLLLRARTFTRLGDPAAAARDYQKALAVTPRPEPDLILETATALANDQRPAEALEILGQGIARIGPLASLVVPALELDVTNNRWDAALQLTETMRASAPRPEPWMARRASILARAGRIKESRLAWQSLLDHLSGLPPAERGSLAMFSHAEEARAALASLTSGIVSGAFPQTEPARNGPSPLIERRSPIAREVRPSTNDITSSGSLTRGPYLQQASPVSLVVRWRSSLAVAGQVSIGPSAGVTGQTFDEAAPGTDHSVKLTGLLPDTTYFYSVGSPGEILAGSDATHTFTTPPVAGTAKNTRLWVLGDAGTNSTDQLNVRDAFYTFTGSRTPDLCLLLGDNAYEEGTDAEYQTALFDTYSAMLRKSPFWSCLGNHETNQSTDFVDIYPYFDIFTFPANGEAGGTASGTEHYFSFDYGNIHFISLDSMTACRAPDGAMATWLADDLASTTATWIIAFFHHPPYTKGSHDSDTEIPLVEMRENILPILENGGVDLVLSGHSHCYERSFLLDGHYGLSGSLVPSMKKNPGDGRPIDDGAYVKPLTGPRDHSGTVYNVTGSAGQTSGGSIDHPAMVFSVSELGSVVLDINGTRLDSIFLRDDGTIRDTYTILKQGEADSDADGMPDTYEISNSLNRHDPEDALLDNDGDGTRNLDEFVFGRPAAKADVYSFTTTVDSTAGTATVVFPTVIGRTYRVYWSHTLLASDWQPGSPSLPGTGSNVSWTDTGPAAPRRFYKIQASTAP